MPSNITRVEGGDHYLFFGITEGIIRTRVLIEGGPYMRKYGMYDKIKQSFLLT